MLLSGSPVLVFAICDVTKYGGSGNKRPSKRPFPHHSTYRLVCASIIWVYLDRLADVGKFNLPPHPTPSDRVAREHVQCWALQLQQELMRGLYTGTAVHWRFNLIQLLNALCFGSWILIVFVVVCSSPVELTMTVWCSFIVTCNIRPLPKTELILDRLV